MLSIKVNNFFPIVPIESRLEKLPDVLTQLIRDWLSVSDLSLLSQVNKKLRPHSVIHMHGVLLTRNKEGKRIWRVIDEKIKSRIQLLISQLQEPSEYAFKIRRALCCNPDIMREGNPCDVYQEYPKACCCFICCCLSCVPAYFFDRCKNSRNLAFNEQLNRLINKEKAKSTQLINLVKQLLASSPTQVYKQIPKNQTVSVAKS